MAMRGYQELNSKKSGCLGEEKRRRRRRRGRDSHCENEATITNLQIKKVCEGWNRNPGEEKRKEQIIVWGNKGSSTNLLQVGKRKKSTTNAFPVRGKGDGA